MCKRPRILILCLSVILCLSWGTPALASLKINAAISCGLSDNKSPLELDMDMGGLVVRFWGDSHDIPSPGPTVSVTDIDVDQSLFGIGYRHKLEPFFAEAGIRKITHNKKGYILKTDDKGNSVTVPTTIKNKEVYNPYFSIGVNKLIGRFGSSACGMIDTDGYDLRASVFYSITEDFRIAGGYRYWSMDEWYSGYFIGLNLVE